MRRILCGVGSGNNAEIVIHTTSTSATWRVNTSLNSGSLLKWTVTGDASGVYDADRPFVDLSGNIGTAIITVTSVDNLLGLTQFKMSTSSLLVTKAFVNNCLGLTDLTISVQATLNEVGLNNLPLLDNYLGNSSTSLSSLDFSGCPVIGSINLTSSPSITTLILGNSDFTLSAKAIQVNLCDITDIDLSKATGLERLRLNNANLSTLDISANVNLKFDVWFGTQDTPLPVFYVNKAILDLDSHGTSNGSLIYTGNESPTATQNTANDVLDAYNNLISRGWTISGDVPA